MPNAHLGIDLGGSNIYSAAFDDDYKLLLDSKIDTEAKEGYAHVIDRIKSQIEFMTNAVSEKSYTLATIGLGVPGVVSTDTDFVRIAPNLGWENKRPLMDLGLAIRKDIKVRLANDVNAGLMGELVRMPLKPAIAVAYFCGTGIGGAIAIHGKLLTGADGGAGEVGHMVVRDGGRKPNGAIRGSLESYIGKWALNKRIDRYLDSKKKTMLRDLIDYNLKKTPVKSSTLKKAYERGDSFAQNLMNGYYARYLATGLSQTINLLNPDLIILGGGVMESLGVKLLPHIHTRLSTRCINPLPQIRLAELGDLAGPTGAAFLARNQDGS